MFCCKECIDSPMDPIETETGDDVCALESVQITFDEEDDKLSDSDTGVLLHVQETVDNEEECSDVGPEPTILKVALDSDKDNHADVGHEPVTVVEAVVDTTGTSKSDSMRKSPSLIKRMLQKSTTLVKKTTKGHRHQLPPSQQRRRRVAMKRMVQRPR